MKPLILALSVALPQFCLEQNKIAQKLSQAFDLNVNDKEKLIRLYKNTAIEKRYTVIEDFLKPISQWDFWGNNFPDELPTTQKRNIVYKKYAPKLALDAARAAIEEWGDSKDKITHVISVSCTGMMAPGIELLISKELELSEKIKRLGINFMGCFGAFRALEAAHDIVKADNNNCVLIVCVELCSLHMQLSIKPEVLIGNALFGDGAAAVIVGGCSSNKKPLWQIESCASEILPNSVKEMTWKIGDAGFVMKLSRNVPNLIKQNIKRITKQLIQNYSSQDFLMAIHPGGRRIVEDIEEVMNLSSEQTISSWNVLKNFGNMSSVTFLFVLNDILQRSKEKKFNQKYTLGLGFGPGLSCESIVLKNLF